MSGSEFRILGEMAACIGLMLPVGLVVYALKRRGKVVPALVEGTAPLESVASETVLPLNSEAISPDPSSPPVSEPSPISAPPFKLGKGELVVGIVLSLLLLAATFGAKAIELSKPETASQPMAPISAGMLLLNLVVMQGMQLGIAAAWFFTARKISPVKVFELKKFKLPKALGLATILLIPAAIIALLAMVLVSLQLKYLGWPMEEQDAVQMLKGSKDIATVLVMVLGACIGAPLVEEIIFRGMIYAPLRNVSGKWFAMIFSALWFAVIHVSLPVFVPLALLGFFFALAYEITGSLTISIFMHMIFNSVQVFFALQHG